VPNDRQSALPRLCDWLFVAASGFTLLAVDAHAYFPCTQVNFKIKCVLISDIINSSVPDVLSKNAEKIKGKRHANHR
jgi:hypothetical protein